jgi:N-acetylmuramoyl-L-alanine amidase
MSTKCDPAAPLVPIWYPSPNHGVRREGLTPSLVVLHFTAMDSAGAALARLCDPLAEVSAHYLIGGDGQLWQMVAEDRRAWHAGAGSWAGQGDINSRSIGIELDNRGTHPFSEPQMAVLQVLLGQILARWSIAPEGVIAHSDMAPGRKADPGPRFDWARLASLGLARATPPASEAASAAGDVTAQSLTSARFTSLCAAAGYSAESCPEALLQALRLRHAPMRQGSCCAADLALLQALAS